MGIVYRAEDTKLKRTVALKFLPKGLEVHEPERARFLQEAQAASALNHQNVCTIYDIKEEADQHFIVMENVDGKTLRQLIPIQKIQDVINYAIQIGEALQEAHSHGIVHRDVKPENIMVNTKNQIKVMDFGLAKLKGSLKLTRTSSTVGTLAYMAPEQIQGGEVDARSDIFSFGIVLFEMLTGRLPFRGEHEAAMMYSIVNEEPQPIERYKPDVPPLLANIIQRALEKDANDRYQSTSDMVIELRRVQKKTTKVSRGLSAELPSTSPVETVSPERTVSKKPFKKIVWIGIGAVALLAILTGVYLFFLKPGLPTTLNPDMTFRVLPIQFTEVGAPSLSQDGNWAAFSAADLNNKWDVYFMNTTSGESRRITSDSSRGMNGVDISPDGSQVVYSIRYWRNDSTQYDVAVVSTLGGSSKKIVERGSDARWQPDGKRIGYLRDKNGGSQTGKAELWTIKPDGSDNRCELVDSVSIIAEGFCWSPDGQSICWIRNFNNEYNNLVVYSLSSRETCLVTFDKEDIRDVCWALNDQILFSSNRSGNRNIWMVPASGGIITQITKGVGPDNSIQISRDGSRLLYRQSQYIGHIWIAGIDGSNPHQITFDDAYIFIAVFTPDGKEVLFPITSKQGTHLYSIDRDGKNRRQLTLLATTEESFTMPTISPDGRWIVFGKFPRTSPVDSTVVFLIDVKSPSIPKPVGEGIPNCWIDEKTFVSFVKSRMSSWIYCIEGGKPQKFFEDSTTAMPLQGGKYVCYGDYRPDRRGPWISAASDVKDPWLPSPKQLPSWVGGFDKSGKFGYGVKNAGELRRISIPSGKEEVIRGAFPGLNSTISLFDISYDGKEIVYTDARVSSKLIIIENPFK